MLASIVCFLVLWTADRLTTTKTTIFGSLAEVTHCAALNCPAHLGTVLIVACCLTGTHEAVAA